MTPPALKLSPALRFGAHALLIVMAIPCLLPLIWMVSTSLKSDAQVFPQATEGVAALNLADFVPSPVKWGNYADALQAVPFGTYLRNTLFLCFMNVVGAVFSSAMVAYGFARMKFRGKGVLFVIMLATMMLPPQVVMIPTFVLFQKIGWYGTYMPLIAPYFCAVPFFIFLMTQFFRNIPHELTEAARIDGCGEFRIFFQIYLPLSFPVLATCALFQFIGTWNDFFGPLIYLNDPSRYTIAYGLQQFVGAFDGQWALLMSGATIFTVPIIVLFFLAQKTFIQGIATTGGK